MSNMTQLNNSKIHEAKVNKARRKIQIHNCSWKCFSNQFYKYIKSPNIIDLNNSITHVNQSDINRTKPSELPDVQAGFRKAEEPEIKLPTSSGSLKK